MSSKLAGAAIAVIGGDDREIVLVAELVRMGADVRVAGISRLAENQNVQCFENVADAVKDARFVILPMPGIDEKGLIKAKYASQPLKLNNETMLSFREDCLVIVGFARPLLKDLVRQRGIRMVEIADRDEVAILNSIPSAEGAIQLAMEATDITINGSEAIVIGFGRCGVTLARMLDGIGARTSVVARKPKDLARIREMGLTALTYEAFKEQAGKVDFIFNTVPALVVDDSILKAVKKDIYICDIASAPGGVDFTAAKALGINAVLAPGLPGKVAPRTAGMILAEVIPEIILTELTNPSFLSYDGSR